MSRKEETGLRIKNERQRLGWSLARLSSETSTLSKSRISNYEQGIRKVGVDEAKELANALGCTAGYLLGIESKAYLSETASPTTNNTKTRIAEDTATYNDTGLWSLLDIYRTLPANKREQLIDEALRLQVQTDIEKEKNKTPKKKRA